MEFQKELYEPGPGPRVVIQGKLCERLVRKILSSRSPMLGNLMRPGFKTGKAERGREIEHLPGMSEVLSSIPSPARKN